MNKQLHEELKNKARIADQLQATIISLNNNIGTLSCKNIIRITLTIESGFNPNMPLGVGDSFVAIPVEIQDQFIEVTKGLLLYQVKNTELKYSAL